MATIKLGTTKAANKALSYAEKRAEVSDGVDCLSGVAKAQMKATRALHGKEGGIQAHTVIQSFKPGEVNAEQANEAGLALAKEIAGGHEAAVYTHTDKDHIHNHIVINAVHMDTGRKYQAHGKEMIDKVRDMSDKICKERGLSVPEKGAEVRYTLAEQGLIEKEQWSWKDEVREKIDAGKKQTANWEEFQSLLDQQGVKAIERGKNVTFLHKDTNQKVRGSKLGDDYQKERIVHELEIAQTRVPVIDWNKFDRKTKRYRDRQAKRAAGRTDRADGKGHDSASGGDQERKAKNGREPGEDERAAKAKRKRDKKNERGHSR